MSETKIEHAGRTWTGTDGSDSRHWTSGKLTVYRPWWGGSWKWSGTGRGEVNGRAMTRERAMEAAVAYLRIPPSKLRGLGLCGRIVEVRSELRTNGGEKFRPGQPLIVSGCWRGGYNLSRVGRDGRPRPGGGIRGVRLHSLVVLP